MNRLLQDEMEGYECQRLSRWFASRIDAKQTVRNGTAMKFRNFPLSDLNNYKKQPPREPLYTLPEIAERLGVDYDLLKGAMHGKRKAGYPSPPPPAMLTGTSSASRMRTYLYKLSEFKVWWKLRQEFANKEKP